MPSRRLAVLALCAAACAGACSRPGGPGPAGPGADRPLGEREHRMTFPVWGVTAILDPETSAVDEPEQLVISTFARRQPTSGTFELRVGRGAAARGGLDALAAAEREAVTRDDETRAVGELGEVTLLGLPGRAFTFSYDSGTGGPGHGLVAVAIVGGCVVDLRVLASGAPEALTQAASAALGRLAASPSPLAPRPCR